MKRAEPDNLVVGLDIGTAKILVVVGEVDDQGRLEVIGLGHHPAQGGLRRGIISDIDATVQSIRGAIEEAELIAGCQIYSVFAGVSGAHINSLNSHGVVAVREAEVTEGDLNRVLEAAQAMALPDDQHILHMLEQSFTLDGESGIRQPVGMRGTRLESHVHIVTAAQSALHSIEKCVRRCGLKVDQMILEQLAASAAVLGDDEREIGVALIDIGGGTTDIAVFLEGSVRHTGVIPIAGDQVTHDIAVVSRTAIPAAEELKKKYGSALAQMVNADEVIEAPSMGGRPPRALSRQSLAQIIEPRFEELFSLVQADLRSQGLLDRLSAGLVLTGGSVRLPGITELAEDMFQLPVRLGEPTYSGRLGASMRSPLYATGLGLIQFGLQERARLGSAPSGWSRLTARTRGLGRWLKSHL